MNDVRIEDYVQTRAPIKSAMTDIINAMKGPDRSMADFSTITGISTSMLSRIVNGNYTKPISPEILKKIADSKTESCPLDLEDLLEANGMVTKEAASHITLREDRRQKMAEQVRRRKAMKDIVIDELFARGIAIKMLGIPDKPASHMSKLFEEAIVCDRAITLPDEEYIEWGFFMLPFTRDSDNSARDDEYYIHWIISKYAVIFLQDAWEPENSKHNKFSFVFADKTYFEMFVEALQVSKLNNRISAILINVNERKVIKEHNFPCMNFPETGSLFEMSVQQESERDNGELGQMSLLDRLSGEDIE